jgi:hypothetical protein
MPTHSQPCLATAQDDPEREIFEVASDEEDGGTQGEDVQQEEPILVMPPIPSMKEMDDHSPTASSIGYLILTEGHRDDAGYYHYEGRIYDPDYGLCEISRDEHTRTLHRISKEREAMMTRREARYKGQSQPLPKRGRTKDREGSRPVIPPEGPQEVNVLSRPMLRWDNRPTPMGKGCYTGIRIGTAFAFERAGKNLRSGRCTNCSAGQTDGDASSSILGVSPGRRNCHAAVVRKGVPTRDSHERLHEEGRGSSNPCSRSRIELREERPPV